MPRGAQKWNQKKTEYKEGRVVRPSEGRRCMAIAYERHGVECIMDDLRQHPGDDHAHVEQAALGLGAGKASVGISKHGRVFKDRGTHRGEVHSNAPDEEEPA